MPPLPAMSRQQKRLLLRILAKMAYHKVGGTQVPMKVLNDYEKLRQEIG